MIAKLSGSSVSQEKLTEPRPRGPMKRPVLPSLGVRSEVNGCPILGKCSDCPGRVVERRGRARIFDTAEARPNRKTQTSEQGGPLRFPDRRQKSEHEIFLLPHERPAVVTEKRVPWAIGLVCARSMPDPTVKA